MDKSENSTTAPNYGKWKWEYSNNWRWDKGYKGFVAFSFWRIKDPLYKSFGVCIFNFMLARYKWESSPTTTCTDLLKPTGTSTIGG